MAQRAASGGAGGRSDGSGRPRREARLGRALGAGTTAPHAVVLVLPGGASHSERRTSPAATAVAVSLARRLAHTAREETVVAHTVHYRYRGWNGEAAHPAQDARWALDEVVRRYGDVSICLAGVDIGARAALRVAGHPAVASVLAIAPRLPEPGTETSGHTGTDGEPCARADCSEAGTPQLERHTPPRTGSSKTTWRSRLRGPLERRRGTTPPPSRGEDPTRSGTPPAPSEPAGRREQTEPVEPVETAEPVEPVEAADSTGEPAGSSASAVSPSVAEEPGKPGDPGKPGSPEARTASGTQEARTASGTPAEQPERTERPGPTEPPRHSPIGAPSAQVTAPTPEPWESSPPPRSSEPVEQLVGRHVLFVHGTDDTTTDPELSYQLAERAKSVNDDVCRFEVHTDGHTLLQHHSEVAALAGDFVLGTLCGQDFSRPVTDALAAPPPLGLRMPLASGFGRSLRG